MAYFKKGKNKSKIVVCSQLAEWSFPKPEDSGSIKAKRNFYLAFIYPKLEKTEKAQYKIVTSRLFKLFQESLIHA